MEIRKSLRRPLSRDSHIHRQHPDLRPGSHPVHVGRSPCQILRHHGSDLLPALAHALADDTVVRAEYDEAPGRGPDLRVPCKTADPDKDPFKLPEAVQRLRDVVPALPDLRRGSLVPRRKLQ